MPVYLRTPPTLKRKTVPQTRTKRKNGMRARPPLPRHPDAPLAGLERGREPEE
jgi:hypothetical protein